ncbi:MAG: hypothetical protein H8E44_17940 [Planctomycetes bacterium]|nr:hypothetical protein [Planctomycetota bacterium]MBL7040457.1 hypothetical protein [Pirellulaceae bacterium]
MNEKEWQEFKGFGVWATKNSDIGQSYDELFQGFAEILEPLIEQYRQETGETMTLGSLDVACCLSRELLKKTFPEMDWGEPYRRAQVQTAEKRVVLKLTGEGPWDGTYDSESDNYRGRNLANLWFVETKEGTIGETIRPFTPLDVAGVQEETAFVGAAQVLEVSEREPKQQRYTVVDREETDEVITVTFEYKLFDDAVRVE